MTTVPASPAASQQAAVDAALLVLKSMGLSPEDLTAAPRQRPTVPTFAGYVPVVSAAVTAGTRRAYGSTGTGLPSSGAPGGWTSRRRRRSSGSSRTPGRTWCPAATPAAGAAPPRT
jgi:hypothetical protein